MKPKKAFDDQKRHSEDRDIPFLFSYSEWLEMWLLSGKWTERGKGKGKYQMCRYGDEGAYSPRNCYIGTFEDNMLDTRQTTSEQELEIRTLYKNTNYSQREIGNMFGLHQTTISRIITGSRGR